MSGWTLKFVILVRYGLGSRVGEIVCDVDVDGGEAVAMDFDADELKMTMSAAGRSMKSHLKSPLSFATANKAFTFFSKFPFH